MAARRRALAAPLLAAVALAGCANLDNAPAAYDDTVRTNYTNVCTGSVVVDSTTTSLSSTSYCECTYQWFVDNVPYNDDDRSRFPGYEGPTFIDLDRDLRSDPESMPQDVEDGLATCPQTASESTGGSVPGTTPGTTEAPVGPVAPTTSS